MSKKTSVKQTTTPPKGQTKATTGDKAQANVPRMQNPPPPPPKKD